MDKSSQSSSVVYHETTADGAEGVESVPGTGGVVETATGTAEEEGGGVDHPEIVEDHHATEEAETMTVIVTIIVDTTDHRVLEGDPLLVVVGIFSHQKATGNIHLPIILTGGRTDHLPLVGLVDTVHRPLAEVVGGMADLLDHLAPLEAVYLNPPTRFPLKVHLKMAATVGQDQTVAAPLVLREVVLEWAHLLEKDTEVAPHLPVHLPREEIWDMDDEAPHRI